jgi:hypothetical protein
MRYADCKCTCTENFYPEHTYTFTGPCVVTGKTYSVTVKSKELNDYRRGGLIQKSLHSVSVGDREFLMSGISPEGWEKDFSEDDDY